MSNGVKGAGYFFMLFLVQFVGLSTGFGMNSVRPNKSLESNRYAFLSIKIINFDGLII
jgi:hypothetical protein